MKCNQVEELLPLYAKNDLDSPTARSLVTHLQSCPACVEFAVEYKAVWHMLDLYQPPEFSETLHEEIRRNVLSEIKKEQAKPGLLPRLASLLLRPKYVGVIPALLILAFGIIGFLSLNNLTGDNSSLATLDRNDVVTKQSQIEPQYEVKPPELQPVTKEKEKASKTNVRNISLHQNRVVNFKPSIASRVRYNQTKIRRTRTFGNPQSIAKIETPLNENQSGGLDTDSAFASVSAEKVLRMEMQTSNPNIRIILFSKK